MPQLTGRYHENGAAQVQVHLRTPTVSGVPVYTYPFAFHFILRPVTPMGFILAPAVKRLFPARTVQSTGRLFPSFSPKQRLRQRKTQLATCAVLTNCRVLEGNGVVN